MTSFAFILGCVPLWTTTGAGSVARQIMGTTVIGGMLAASAIGIFFVPAIFFLVEKWSGASKERIAAALPGTPGRRRETEMVPGPHGQEQRKRRFVMKKTVPSWRLMSAILVASLAAIVMAGCTVGPNYHRPAVQPFRPRNSRSLAPAETDWSA